MRISDWSSDVCSSDLDGWALPATAQLPASTAERWARQWGDAVVDAAAAAWSAQPPIDLSFAAEGAGVEWSGVPTLAPRPRSLPRGQVGRALCREGGVQYG